LASNRVNASARIEAEDRAVDAIVGHNIRARRTALGLTQQHVADDLGLTFQQVQKYERGVNRVSASTLWRLARALRCEVGDLFTGAEGGHGPAEKDARQQGAVVRLLAEVGGLDMAEAFPAVPASVRKALLTIALALGRTK
jgi:transcriptional regulator with XRE-family HTH domain